MEPAGVLWMFHTLPTKSHIMEIIKSALQMDHNIVK